MSCFPDEIWLQILSNLPPCDLKSACLVSRRFHELAVIYQLMSLDIFIGRFPLPFEREELVAPWQDEKEEAVMNNVWDILLRISGQEKPVLAPVVVGFRVIVSTEHNLVFERHHIRSVLKKMVNLRSFEWTGNPLPLDIAKELVESCPGINTLRLSQLYGSAAEVITGLRALKELRLIDPNKSSASIGLECFPDAQAVTNLIHVNAPHLKELSLNGQVAWNVNLLRVADSLTHLAINNTRDNQGLDLFLRHAHNLVSLTLLDLFTFDFLPLDSRGLPRLRDLKLQLDHPVIDDNVEGQDHDLEEDSEILLAFIRTHENLARFDFSLWPNAPGFVSPSRVLVQHNDDWFSNIVYAVCALESATTIGLSFPSISDPRLMDTMLFKIFGELSKECTALRLCGVVDASFEPHLKKMHRTLPRLSFLCISNSRPQEYCKPKHILPSASDLTTQYKLFNLQSVCLGNEMFDINRGGENAGVKWPEEKVRLRKESDFHSADAHWLMSYRSLSEHYDFSSQPYDDDDDDDDPF